MREEQNWVVRCRIIPAPRLKDSEMTYRTTNFLGFKDRTGSRAKQMTKQAIAARLQTAKIINRSQRLTVGITLSQPHAFYRKQGGRGVVMFTWKPETKPMSTCQSARAPKVVT